MSLISRPSFDLTIEQAALMQKTIDYERASLSPNTLRSYRSMWKRFETWCGDHLLSALPTSAETVALYISSIGEEVSFSTLDSTLAAIEAAHEKAGRSIVGNPALYRRVRKGIRRTHKENQTQKQAKPLTILSLKGACCKIGNDMAGRRDKALLTLTFFGAFRRSEVVSLDVEHLEFNDRGVAITLLQSKTSDTKQLVYIAHARDGDLCPVKAIKDWLAAAQIKEGPLFRSLSKAGRLLGRLSGHSVSAIIKRHFGDDYSGHSARRGPAIEAAERGASVHSLKKIGRWKGADMAMRYAEAASAFEESTVAVLGA